MKLQYPSGRGGFHPGEESLPNSLSAQRTPTYPPTLDPHRPLPFQQKEHPLNNHSVTQLVAGANHILALTSAGTVYGWGSGPQGQFGRQVVQDELEMDLIPTKIIFLLGPNMGHEDRYPRIVKIASGESHCFAIDDRGNVYAWGLNNRGQLGFGWRGGQFPTGGRQRMSGGTITVPPSGATWAGNVVLRPLKVAALCPSALNGRKVVDIDAGDHHSLFLVSLPLPLFF